MLLNLHHSLIHTWTFLKGERGVAICVIITVWDQWKFFLSRAALERSRLPILVCFCFIGALICTFCMGKQCVFLTFILFFIPYSPFVLDAFKRKFCNEDPIKATIPFLWENFDKEGWSIWRCDYQYPEELKRGFMASNLVGGFFQRIEKLHKYGFSVIYVLGEDQDLSISGVWILRGPKLAFDVSEHCL